jgi:hypothetical protein
MASGFGLKTGSIRVELNSAGIRDLLRSDEVAADIERRAHNVSDAADAAYAMIPVGGRDKGDAPTHITTEVVTGASATRVHARVVAQHPAALAVEVRHRILGRAMDAARAD